MPTNDQDIRALTYLAKRLRDETHGANRWDEAGIAAKVAELKGQQLSQVAERVIRHAADTQAKTPGAILRPFIPAAGDTTTAPRLEKFDRSTFCAVCGEPEDRCRRVWAKDHPFESVERATARAANEQGAPSHVTAAEYARQAVGDSKADGPRTPVERPKPPANPHVDQLRQLAGTQPEENTP